MIHLSMHDVFVITVVHGYKGKRLESRQILCVCVHGGGGGGRGLRSSLLITPSMQL